MSATAAYAEILRKESTWTIPVGRHRAFHIFLKPPRRIRELVKETQQNWVRNTQRLLDQVSRPCILFYFSRRLPRYRERFYSVHALLGEFPQLVTEQMLRSVRDRADRYVECVTRRGSPQLLVDRFTGRPTTVDLSLDRPDLEGVWAQNSYYPSPEMHQDAAAALLPVCREIADLHD